ncbi:MAG TPA: VOC family protein [Sphingomicrobium sp.]|nr:VOC family protein [Sphingomicrobium sp.]
MIDHLELQTRSVAEAERFYRDVLAPLGYRLEMDGPVKGFAADGGLDLFLVKGGPSENIHFAFAAPSRAAVDACWKAGLDNGHATDREPALAPHIHPSYYAGYLRDPDGHLIEFVCQRPE